MPPLFPSPFPFELKLRSVKFSLRGAFPETLVSTDKGKQRLLQPPQVCVSLDSKLFQVRAWVTAGQAGSCAREQSLQPEPTSLRL